MRFPASGFLAGILGLLAAAHVSGWRFFWRAGGVSVSTPFDPWYRARILRLMALVFGLRAVGDFRYVGFFKLVRDSRFAYWDTRLHSPLCLLLAALAAMA